MKTSFVTHFKRRKEGKTDYGRRLNMLRSGSDRLTVRLTNGRVIAQVITYKKDGDRTVVYADSNELKGLGWKHSVKSTPGAYLTGLLCAKKAAKAKVKDCVLDIGRKTPTNGGRVFAVLKGAVDGGLKVPHDPKREPKEDRIKGAHIEAHTKKKVTADFDKVKEKIMKL